MNRITALLRLTRAEHSVMLVVAVIAAEAVAKSIPALAKTPIRKDTRNT